MTNERHGENYPQVENEIAPVPLKPDTGGVSRMNQDYIANGGLCERATSDTHAGPVDPANDSRRRDTRQRTKRGAGHLVSGRLRPEPQVVTDVAGDAFCHAELRVCGIDRSGVRSAHDHGRPEGLHYEPSDRRYGVRADTPSASS